MSGPSGGKHVSVSGALYARLKARAQRDGRRMSEIVEEAIRNDLNEFTAAEWAKWTGEAPQ